VRQGIRELQRRPHFYVDYPYALAYTVQPKAAPAGLLDAYESLDVLLSDDETERKLAACREYSGELDRLRTLPQFGDFVTAENLRRETFYVPQPLD
jgi:hypothetical protein